MSHLPLSQYDLEQIDALVDGDLQEPFYSQLLTRLEQAPDGWKSCALAFLEEQALNSDFQQFRHADFVPFTQRDPLGDPQTILGPNPAATYMAIRVESPHTQPTAGETRTLNQTNSGLVKSTDSRKHLGNFTAIAVATLLSFTLGWQLRIWNEVDRSRPVDVGANPEPQFAVNSSTDIDRPLSLNQPALGSLAQSGLDPDKTFNIDQRSNAAVSDFSDRPRNLAEVAAVSDYPEALDFPLHDKFEKRFVRVNSAIDAELERHQTLVPYIADDGSQVMVPVQSMRLRPIAIHGF
jgi:hypothetical protein